MHSEMLTDENLSSLKFKVLKDKLVSCLLDGQSIENIKALSHGGPESLKLCDKCIALIGMFIFFAIV